MNDFELRYIDVKNAYLNGPLDEEIYMVAPDGSPSKYWRLHKGLYGLRQAGRQWYHLLNNTYSDLGYTRCESDWSVYVRKTTNAFTISATSVDDLLLASNSKSESDLATSQIQQKFPITDNGDIAWLLGCRVRRWRERRVLMIDQELLRPSSYLGVVRSLVPIFCLMCTYRTVYPRYRTISDLAAISIHSSFT